MRDNEKVKVKENIPHTSSTGLSGSQFSTLKSAELNDAEGPQNYNNSISYIIT
jgi:hypothetical protein